MLIRQKRSTTTVSASPNGILTCNQLLRPRPPVAIVEHDAEAEMLLCWNRVVVRGVRDDRFECPERAVLVVFRVTNHASCGQLPGLRAASGAIPAYTDDSLLYALLAPPLQRRSSADGSLSGTPLTPLTPQQRSGNLVPPPRPHCRSLVPSGRVSRVSPPRPTLFHSTNNT